MKSLYASELCIHARSPHYTVLQKENSIESLFLLLYGNMEIQARQRAPTIDEPQ